MLNPSPIASVAAEGSTIETRVVVQPVLGLVVGSDNYVVDVTPTETGEFSSQTSSVVVTTNNETGYSLYLATANGRATLASTEGVAEINPVTGAVSAAGFGANTWGYNLGKETISEATTYQAVPTQNSAPAGGSETPVEQDEYNLTFGAFVNTDLPGGAYSNQVVVSAVANPKYVTWDELTTMQEMAYTACDTADTGDTKQLTDTRDDNTYTVAKLPNGTCWMTQNLRLSSGRTLTSADSNVTRDWPFPTNPFVNGGYSFTEPQSTTSDEASYGGYYNYCAASAGTVCSDITAQDATQDICPKGWRLPTRDEMESVTNYQDAFSPVFSGLYAYGALYSTGSWGSWWSATAYNNNTHQYVLYYNDNRLYTSSGDGKHFGISVRCISTS